MEDATFYLIWDYLLGKECNGKYFLLRDGAWFADEACGIIDHKVGYDPSEPPGSPYGFWNRDIINEMRTVSAEEAQRYIESRESKDGC